MRLVRTFVTLLLAAIVALGAASLFAQDSPLRFLHALQANGYGDMAIEYLKSLEKQRAVPPEIQDVWDLEMSNSCRAAAAAAFDEKDRDQLMAESQRCLDKFIKEKPDHPEAVTAMSGWASFLTRQALQLIQQAKAAEGKDKAQCESYLADARAALADARTKIENAEKRFKAKLAELPPPSTAKSTPKKNGRRDATAEAREQTDANLQEAELQLALIDYYVAQTYTDPKSAGHLAALKKAAQAFNAVFQHERLRGSDTGLKAKLWEGKTRDELGDPETALEIYNEILVYSPDAGEGNVPTWVEDLVAQAEYFRLLILAKRKPQDFAAEATAWLKSSSRFKPTDGYQGISLELARSLAKRAATASTTEKTKLNGEAMRILNDMVAVRSPYQSVARRLLHDLKMASSQAKAGAGKVAASTFDEAVGMGDDCASVSDWNKALEWYDLALKLAAKTSPRDPSRMDKVQEDINNAQLEIARELYIKGKFNECVEMVGKVVRDDEGNAKKGSEAAARASAVGLFAARNLYEAASADKKPAALDRLVKLAEFTEKNWPDKPEADDARMTRAQAKLFDGQPSEALAIFERVNPKSERYPMAMYQAGQIYAGLYLAERGRPDDARINSQMDANRAKAVERLNAGLEALKKQVEPGRPLPKHYLETQVLLAEIRLEAGETKEAAEIYRPLVEIIKAEKPQSLDNATLRVFLGAVRAYCELNELGKAGEVGAVLMDLGPDTLDVNNALIIFASRLDHERKKASAVVTELESTAKDQELNAAKVKLNSVQDLLRKILLKLADRQELSLPGMIFLGETLNAVGMTAEASQLFQRIIDRTKTDTEFAKAAEKAMPRIRTQLPKMLREQGKFDEAMKQVEQLVKDNPNALEPLMEKGKILEAWAEKNPAKFDEAVAHWAMVRNRLQPLKKKPDEYYEVMYNVANCLVHEAERNKDKATATEKANQAEKVLKSPLTLNPKLNGNPDTAAKYRALLKKAIELQGRSPDGKDAKKDEKRP